MMILKILVPAFCYFLFNLQFFRCCESALKVTPIGKKDIIWTFVLNESIFIICSISNLHLIVNWLIFLILLLAEQWILYRQPIQRCLLLSLLGTQLGLAVNILFRSLLAILFNTPLIAFDNNSSPYNLKSYPILLGFLVVAALFWLVIRIQLLKRFDLVMQDKRTLIFLIGLQIVMYSYLCMNLLVYSVTENNLVLKLWSMKSSVFVIIGEYLSLLLSIRLGQISIYRAESHAAKEQLARERLRERELRSIAATDPLTGCENRLQLRLRLQEVLESGSPFCLCFVDMNGLKAVNDNSGHETGDLYIQTVSKVLRQSCHADDCLFRYGGDEFILLFFHTTAAESAMRLEQAQLQLNEERINLSCSFSMGICFGIATPEDGTDAMELIEAADSRMYEMKQSYK